MLRLVNRLIDLNAVEAGVFRLVEKPVAVATLVQQSVESLRPRATAKGLALHCSIAPDFPAWLATDPERLRQIVINLVGNAVKFTAGGQVQVGLRVAGTAPLTVELGVRDTGPGIAAHEQPKLFQ